MIRQKTVRHRCLRCGKQFPHAFVTTCSCGGLVDVEYDLERAAIAESPNPFERYFDLLPLESRASLARDESGFTPCVQAERLGEAIGLPRLFLKNETVLPTGTTKDRMAPVVLALFEECGVREFSTSSTGNSSTSLAAHIRRFPNQHAYLFSGEDFCDRVDATENAAVDHFVLRGATFVEAFACAAAFAARRGIVSERGFFNPARREGLKLAFLESAEQVSVPIDWYVQAVSSAMGVYGTFKGARELRALGRIDRLPRLLCVQQESCSPMVNAFARGSERILPEHVVARPSGIASAILRGNPTRSYPYTRAIVLESNGAFVAVSETEIREARAMMAELAGVPGCFTSAAALAGVWRAARQGTVSPTQTVLVNVTGRDRRPMPPAAGTHWMRFTQGGWIPEDFGDLRARELCGDRPLVDEDARAGRP